MSWLDEDPRAANRVTTTRLLCVSVYGGWIVLLGLVLSLVVVPAISDLESGDVFAAVLPYGLALYAWWFVGRAILRFWRRCDRCRKPLFAELSWFKKDIPHREAKTLLGSHFNFTAWRYISSGAANCMWCGHRDGKIADYVVIK